MVDGWVVVGTFDVDQSLIMGELLLVVKMVGDVVYVGMVNGCGMLCIVVDWWCVLFGVVVFGFGGGYGVGIGVVVLVGVLCFVCCGVVVCVVVGGVFYYWVFVWWYGAVMV